MLGLIAGLGLILRLLIMMAKREWMMVVCSWVCIVSMCLDESLKQSIRVIKVGI
jgi:hypothetical protein